MSPETSLFGLMEMEIYDGWMNERIMEAGWIDG